MSFALIHLDSFLPVSWSPRYGDRAFQFDAFVSHNRGDAHSRKLLDELAARGATTWHDGDQDLRDRRVQEAVTSALVRSRFVVVVVDDQFRESPWCRAEYLPALEVERHADASRVVVVQMAPGATIPEELTEAARFECFRRRELDRLAMYLREGNRPPFTTEQEEARPRAADLVAPVAFDTARRNL
jgi:TIR domain